MLSFDKIILHVFSKLMLDNVHDTLNLFFRCRSSIQKCQNNPCRYGGMCVTQGDDNYYCNCIAGYTGIHCETNEGLYYLKKL